MFPSTTTAVGEVGCGVVNGVGMEGAVWVCSGAIVVLYTMLLAAWFVYNNTGTIWILYLEMLI